MFPEVAEYGRIPTKEKEKNKERDTRMRKMVRRTAMRTFPKVAEEGNSQISEIAIMNTLILFIRC